MEPQYFRPVATLNEMVLSSCRSSVAEHWQLKLVVLDSIPNEVFAFLYSKHSLVEPMVLCFICSASVNWRNY